MANYMIKRRQQILLERDNIKGCGQGHAQIKKVRIKTLLISDRDRIGSSLLIEN
jgi:hypothetical protein